MENSTGAFPMQSRNKSAVHLLTAQGRSMLLEATCTVLLSSLCRSHLSILS